MKQRATSEGQLEQAGRGPAPMPRLIMWLAVFLAFVGGYVMAESQEPKIEWRGWPVFAGPYSGIDPGIFAGGAPPDMFTDKTIEIGFREDGVVVWRKKPAT